ncbi:MAG: hypothetical protein WCW14_03350 [Candidatus Paceibacterota bacterium]|jgi:dihydroorotate dehydrogenase
MIKLSNGHKFEYMAASGALAFDGKGWLWEWPLRWAGLIKLGELTIVAKTVTFDPRQGNLRWWKPWSCVRLMGPDSAVNKVGLTNRGVYWWYERIGHKVRTEKISLVGSIYGTPSELIELTRIMNKCDLVGLEVNPSCPNTGHGFDPTEATISAVKAVCEISRHPVIVKVSVAQDYLAIAYSLKGAVEAISFNSVPWEILSSPGMWAKSPLWRLEKKVGGGGGGVSGQLAQKFNWDAMRNIHSLCPDLPLIGSSVMSFGDVAKVRRNGASAISFGTLFLRRPWMPARIIKQDKQERRKNEIDHSTMV